MFLLCILCLLSFNLYIFTISVLLTLLGPPHSHPANQPWSPASRGEAIYSNHRDPARAPQSPRGLIGNQRDESMRGRKRERGRIKVSLNIKLPLRSITQSCSDMRLSCWWAGKQAGGRGCDEGCKDTSIDLKDFLWWYVWSRVSQEMVQTGKWNEVEVEVES